MQPHLVLHSFGGGLDLSLADSIGLRGRHLGFCAFRCVSVAIVFDLWVNMMCRRR